MKVGRRGFLGLLGAATVSGPSAAAKTMTDLQLPGVGTLTAVAGPISEGLIGQNDTGWAAKRLAKLDLLSALQKEERRKSYNIHSLDVNTASLRSMSLAAKIRISTDRQYEVSLAKEKNWLQRVIDGYEDY